MANINFKNSELGPIPNEWEVKALGEIADVTKLAGFEFTEHIVYSDQGKIIALRGLNIKNGNLVLDDVKYIDESNFSKLGRSKLYINDIIFTYVGTVGEVAIINENDKYYLAPNVSRIRIKSTDLPKFICHLMRSDRFYKKIIFPLIATSSQPALSMENVRRFLLPLPPLPEQRRIAAALSDIDALIDKLDALIDKKRLIKQATMQQLLSGKKRINGFNDKWVEKKLGEIAETSSGGTPSRSNDNFYNGDIKWFTTTELKDCFLYDSNEHISIDALQASSAKLFPKGTLLMAMYGATIGRLGILQVDAATNQACCAIFPSKDIDTVFLFYYLFHQREKIISLGSGAGQPNISQGIVQNLNITLPPTLAEQTAISKILSDMDEEISLLEAKKEKYTHLKQGMMSELLSGRIRI